MHDVKDDNVNCFDPCARVRRSFVQLRYILWTKLKEKKQTTGNTAAGKMVYRCQVHVVYNLTHVETERTYTPAQLQTLVESCHRPFPFVPPSAISTFVPPSAISRKRSPNLFASALVSNQSRCFVKRSAVLFVVSNSRICRMCASKSTSNVFASEFLNNFHCVFLHRLLDCNNRSSRWYVPLSTLSARCPATGIDESGEKDHPYHGPNFLLDILRFVQLACWITHASSVGQCVTRESAGSDKPWFGGVGFATRDRFSSFVFKEKSVFSAFRIAVAVAASAYSSGSEISFWKFTCAPSMFAFPLVIT